tara:strand:- start:49 stop:303 length:255 start_codon:yes stop_codon:yes gene_type:complete
MSRDINDIKKRILYRSSHRGTKEMDILVKSFVDTIINSIKYEDLLILDNFVDKGDEELLKIKNEVSNSTDNLIYKKFKDYKSNF